MLASCACDDRLTICSTRPKKLRPITEASFKVCLTSSDSRSMRDRIRPCTVSGMSKLSTSCARVKLWSSRSRTNTPCVNRVRITSSMKNGLPSVLLRISSCIASGSPIAPIRLATNCRLCSTVIGANLISHNSPPGCAAACWRTRATAWSGSARLLMNTSNGVVAVSGSKCSANSMDDWSAQCQSSRCSTSGWRIANCSNNWRMHRKTWRPSAWLSRNRTRASNSAGKRKASTVARYGNISAARSPNSSARPRSSLPKAVASVSSSSIAKHSLTTSMKGR